MWSSDTALNMFWDSKYHPVKHVTDQHSKRGKKCWNFAMLTMALCLTCQNYLAVFNANGTYFFIRNTQTNQTRLIQIIHCLISCLYVTQNLLDNEIRA